jgi:hypothetical protein
VGSSKKKGGKRREYGGKYGSRRRVEKQEGKSDVLIDMLCIAIGCCVVIPTVADGCCAIVGCGAYELTILFDRYVYVCLGSGRFAVAVCGCV